MKNQSEIDEEFNLKGPKVDKSEKDNELNLAKSKSGQPLNNKFNIGTEWGKYLINSRYERCLPLISEPLISKSLISKPLIWRSILLTFSWMLLRKALAYPKSPYRGEISHWVDIVLALLCSAFLFLLMFLVIDVIYRSIILIRNLINEETYWPKKIIKSIQIKSPNRLADLANCLDIRFVE